MTPDRPTRRRFLLGTASLVAATGLAGCQGQTGLLEPHLPADRLEAGGWRQIADVDEEATETLDVAGTTQRVSVQTKADVYQNDDPVQRLADRFGVDAEEAALPAELFVAAKTRVDPPLTRLLGFSETVMERAVDAAERQAMSQLREEGIRNVRRVDAGTLDIEAGPTAQYRRYRADYPYEGFQVTYEGMPLSIDAGVLTLEAQLAVWPYQGLLVTAAGIYPGEEGHMTVTAQGRTRELPLDLRPEHYREDVRGLIRLVS